MGKVLVTSASSIANTPLFLGVAAPALNNATKRVYLHEITATPRGANWAVDVQLYLFDNYSGGTEMVSSGNFTPVIGAATYESNFSAGADSWANTGGGTPTIAGNIDAEGRTDVLRVTADAGGDALSISRAATRVAVTHYKVTFDYFHAAGGGVGFLGIGLGGASTTNAFALGTGGHHTVVDDAWTTATLYTNAGADTALDICAFDAATTDGAGSLGANQIIYFDNIKIEPITNYADWTLGATGWSWIYRDGAADKQVNGTTALRQAITAPVVGELYRLSYGLVKSANGLTPSFAGVSLPADQLTGTHVYDFAAAGTTANLDFTADAAAVSKVDNVSLTKRGISTASYFMKDSIRSGTTDFYQRTFIKQPWSNQGWGLYFTTGGSSCIIDAVMVYEVV